ncbi:TetR/AcrR family transcriptional regulator [Thermasporomyces composti]|jgi:AcrR family transcriptional regulator|uniref:TetR family transcriptional regulator n=1 Tax=Thermasporomyces composti TaxID=696763 RepID=A0A3D9V9W1_THECX|nr:TetR/AcrR family transcriptional regulator [Thermasporomyces composti]REF38076.1 TetR family transcriptional regulator [Thermasporomyces composti]
MTTAHSGSGDPRRSLELLWRGREPAGRGPRPGLSLERIVGAAVELADREGIAAVSMRKVAAELGVGTMSLYHYVPGKGELLDLMLDYVVEVPQAPKGKRRQTWREVLETMAWRTWRLYLSHPWLLQVNQARPVVGPKAFAALESVVAGLDGLSLTGQEKMAAIAAVENYVTGAARTYLMRQEASQRSTMTEEDFWALQAPYLSEAMADGACPHLAALPEDSFQLVPEDAFEFGLQALLDGLAATIERRKSAPRRKTG